MFVTTAPRFGEMVLAIPSHAAGAEAALQIFVPKTKKKSEGAKFPGLGALPWG